MKKKLLIITGAGASIDFGFPSGKDIDKLFEEKALELYPLVEEPGKSLYTWVKETSYAKDFESLLYVIENLNSLFSSNKKHHCLKEFLEKMKTLPQIRNFDGKKQTASSTHFEILYEKLLDCLVEDFRKKSKGFKSDHNGHKNEYEKFKSLIDSLENEFEISYVTTNYDDVMHSLLPNNNTGFDVSGNFSREVLYGPNRNLGIHLHGSVHFNMSGNPNKQNIHEIHWVEDLNSTFKDNAFGRNTNETREGFQLANTSIIAGLDKTNQLLREPFNVYYMQLDKMAYDADAILVIGYGFMDRHINKTIGSLCLDKKTRKVFIIDEKNIDEKNITEYYLCFPGNDWANCMMEMFPFDSGSIKQEYSKFSRLKSRYECSNSKKNPLAVWHDGLLNACEPGIIDRIINYLT